VERGEFEVDDAAHDSDTVCAMPGCQGLATMSLTAPSLEEGNGAGTHPPIHSSSGGIVEVSWLTGL